MRRGRIVVNAVSASAGGGVTYLKNVLPRLAAVRGELSFRVFLDGRAAAGFGLPSDRALELAPVKGAGNLWRRVVWEQRTLRALLTRDGADALLSLGNFAMFGCPVPQILLNRNDLYFSHAFEGDLRRRGEYRMLFGNRLRSALAVLSIRSADVNLAPSRAFADRIRAARWTRRAEVRVAPYGVDTAAYGSRPLSDERRRALRLGEPVRRLVLLSHYNYFRNFETLIRAFALMKQSSDERLLLVLTTDIHPGAVYGGYDATAASRLIDRLEIRDDIVMLGPVAYEEVRAVLEACDVFVFPSYAESFGHPMVEAMAAGVPVVAADLPVHREICEDAAVYFTVFDAQHLAAQCRHVLMDAQLRDDLAVRGRARAARFSWDDHVSALLKAINECPTRAS